MSSLQPRLVIPEGKLHRWWVGLRHECSLRCLANWGYGHTLCISLALKKQVAQWLGSRELSLGVRCSKTCTFLVNATAWTGKDDECQFPSVNVYNPPIFVLVFTGNKERILQRRYKCHAFPLLCQNNIISWWKKIKINRKIHPWHSFWLLEHL